MTGGALGSVVLSTVEFDVLWEAARLPTRHVALGVPSPGTTHSERARIVAATWEGLESRGLAVRGRCATVVGDLLESLADPAVSVDVWIRSDRRITALAAATGSRAALGVVDGDEVWLIPARDDTLAESAVSVLGELRAGVGSSVTLSHEVLLAADSQAEGDPYALVSALQDRGVPLWQAQEVAGMFLGTLARGQFGVQRRGRDGRVRRGARVAGFHDTDAGRYLFQLERAADGRDWCTLTPADNRLLARRVWELLGER